MKTVCLCGSDWKLIYVKNSVYADDGEIKKPSELLARGYEEISATVPGNLEIDLMNAEKIEDPFYGSNHVKRDLEYLHSFYIKEFECEEIYSDPWLYFEGLDTVCDVYLNDIFVGHTDNMLIEHKLSVRDCLKIGKNILVVHIRPAVIEARKYPMCLNEHAARYNFESLYIRKAPHMYSWDIMPRIVSAGIWRPVYLVERKKDRIEEFYIYTASCSTDGGKAKLHCYYNTAISRDECLDYTVSIRGVCGDSEFFVETPLYHTAHANHITVENARLWWPRFSGEQCLYNVTVTLSRGGECLDTYTTRLGIRTVALERSSTTDKDGNGKFCFVINGKRIFCMGTNWVPVDALHSRDAQRLPSLLPMLTDINCNTVRLWGGNVYENDMFYDFCDENGILLWQDFSMGCAIYPQDSDFCARMYTEAVSVIKRLRQHPSLALWAGDNENDLAYDCNNGMRARRDPNKNILTRQIIPEALRIHDFTRPYLPSSPYIDEIAFKIQAPLSEDHLWGPRDYFKGNYYSNSVCHFASETGYHGCPSPSSIKRFIPNESLWTSQSSADWDGIDNLQWLYHATACEPETRVAPYTYRIKMMAKQVTTLFGNTVPNTLEDFAKASQISQAEAKKYFIERFRISKWRRTGIIWWNLADGWPQFSDAVVDYYGIRKLAYHYIKRSQQPISMMFDEPTGNAITLFAVNDLCRNAELEYTVTDVTANNICLTGSVTVSANTSLAVQTLDIDVGEKHFYHIKWTFDGKEYSNHYMTNIKNINYPEYLSYLEQCGYTEFEGF